MRAIYEPKGRALEYSLLACNLYGGCIHGCDYCYAPNVLQLNREVFHSPGQAKARKGILKALEKDAAKIKGTNKRVLLCFTCDPYQPLGIEKGLTREALEILNSNLIPFQILTKGGTRACRDFDLYGPNDAFATTLTGYSDSELGAAEHLDRVLAIKTAHWKEIETWVSLEPVLDTIQSVLIIEHTHPYVDLYKIGKLNHRKNVINWRAFGIEAIKLCEKYGVKYYIKDDLAKFLEGVPFQNTDTRIVGRKEVDK